MGEGTLPAWFTALSPRDQDAIKHALSYAQNYSAAGVPGHSQFLLIAKLADLLEEYVPKEDTHDPHR